MMTWVLTILLNGQLITQTSFPIKTEAKCTVYLKKFKRVYKEFTYTCEYKCNDRVYPGICE